MPDTEEAEGIVRRAFLKLGFVLVASPYVGAIGYPVYRYLIAPVKQAEQAAAVKNAELKDADKLPEGSALMFKFGAAPAVLIHHKDGTWSSLSAVCTHLGCTVQFEPDKDDIHCACHGGTYNSKTGANISGPPPKPLPSYHVEVRDGSVAISR
jgi:cytochrome b6-f complex iron-sulfur subunit